MTTVRYVSKKQMVNETGMDALGYAKPKNALILLRKGLSKKVEQEGRGHEAGHIKKGEEGPFLGVGAAMLGGSLISGYMGSKAAGKQAKVGKSQVAESRPRSGSVVGTPRKCPTAAGCRGAVRSCPGNLRRSR